jgi:hypothetical protein
VQTFVSFKNDNIFFYIQFLYLKLIFIFVFALFIYLLLIYHKFYQLVILYDIYDQFYEIYNLNIRVFVLFNNILLCYYYVIDIELDYLNVSIKYMYQVYYIILNDSFSFFIILFNDFILIF